MSLKLLNRLATIGLVSIVVGAVIHVMFTIFEKKHSGTALPIDFRVTIVVCFWIAIAVICCIIYFVLRKHTKA